MVVPACQGGLASSSVSQFEPAEHSDDGEWPRPLYLKQVAGGGDRLLRHATCLAGVGRAWHEVGKARSKQAESCYAPAAKARARIPADRAIRGEREARHGGSISCNPGLCGPVCAWLMRMLVLMALTNDVDGIRNPILFSSHSFPALRGESGMWMWAHGATRAPGEGKGKGGRLRCAGGGARQLSRVALGLSVHLRYGQARQAPGGAFIWFSLPVPRRAAGARRAEVEFGRRSVSRGKPG
jgi:hypothetical protein